MRISPIPFPGNPMWWGVDHRPRNAPTVQRVGPVFALVVPVTYAVAAPPPEAGNHLHHHDPVAHATDLAVLLIVFIITGRAFFHVRASAFDWTRCARG